MRVMRYSSRLTTLMLAAFVAFPSGAVAAPDLITTFPVPSEPLETGGIAVGPDGNLWFGEYSGLSRIGKITPQGEITEFPLPSSGSVGRIVAGPDDNLWFIENNRFREADPEAIAKITPNGQISEFPLSQRHLIGGLTAGPDGNVWFTAGSSIGKITPGGQITEYPLPAQTNSEEIIAGPDGDLWFTALSSPSGSFPEGKFGRITREGLISEFSLPPKTFAGRLFIGPDGKLRLTFRIGRWNKYFSFETESSGIGVVEPSGEFAEEPSYPPCVNCPSTIGSDGNLWYADNQTISRVSDGGELTAFDLPQGVSAHSIVSGPDGNLWFAGTRFLKRPDKPSVTGVIGRIPPSLLEVTLAGEWWNLWVAERWTKLRIACKGDRDSVCTGTLSLRTEVGSAQAKGSKKTVILARRPYRLRAGNEHEFALHLSREAFGIRAKHRVLRDVQATATAEGGQDTERPVSLERPRRNQAIHRHHHRATR
jgi:streptogramin lyase